MKNKDISLTAEQQRVLENVCNSMRNACILGAAGTGKTFLANLIKERLEEDGNKVLVCAPTGRAAELVGGCTVHQAFGLPAGVALTESRKKVRACTSKGLRSADVVIIEEISMVRADYMDAIASSLAKISKSKKIRLICIGDFYQLPPVITGNERKILEDFYGKEIGNGYAFFSEAWRKMDFEYFILKEVIRQADSEFAAVLNRIRAGDKSVVDYINAHTSQEKIEGAPTILLRNDDVDRANLTELRKIPGELIRVPAVYFGNLDDKDLVGYPGELILKEGARVMITVNDNKNVRYDVLSDPNPMCNRDYKFINGSMGTVFKVNICYWERMCDSVIVLLDSGIKIRLYRVKKFVYEFVDEKGKYKRRSKGSVAQLPVHVAFAMSSHRSQGISLSYANIMPGSFTAGMQYVSLSRTKKLKNIHLLRPLRPEDIIVDPEVTEFYKMVESIIASKE